MPSADDFRRELRQQLISAERKGIRDIEVNAGQLHRAVGGYPKPSPRMPNCCSVMRQEMRNGDEVSSERHTDGASFTVRYRLPRP